MNGVAPETMLFAISKVCDVNGITVSSGGAAVEHDLEMIKKGVSHEVLHVILCKAPKRMSIRHEQNGLRKAMTRDIIGHREVSNALVELDNQLMA